MSEAQPRQPEPPDGPRGKGWQGPTSDPDGSPWRDRDDEPGSGGYGHQASEEIEGEPPEDVL